MTSLNALLNKTEPGTEPGTEIKTRNNFTNKSIINENENRNLNETEYETNNIEPLFINDDLDNLDKSKIAFDNIKYLDSTKTYNAKELGQLDVY